MIEISYMAMLVFITVVWVAVRALCALRSGRVSWKREAQLLLAYICLIVVARFVYFPFSLLDGKIQPLVFDAARVFPLWLNFEPLVHLFDYPTMKEALLNLIGNTTMFIPVGVIWPAVFKQLDTPAKAIGAGALFSLCIEVTQLPFFGRASDIDDLLLNTLGFAIGYAIYALTKQLKKQRINPA